MADQTTTAATMPDWGIAVLIVIGIVGTGGPLVLAAMANLGAIVRTATPIIVPLLVLASLIVLRPSRK